MTHKPQESIRVMVCTNGKPLTKEDKLAIKDFIEVVKDRKRRKLLKNKVSIPSYQVIDCDILVS